MEKCYCVTDLARSRCSNWCGHALHGSCKLEEKKDPVNQPDNNLLLKQIQAAEVYKTLLFEVLVCWEDQEPYVEFRRYFKETDISLYVTYVFEENLIFKNCYWAIGIARRYRTIGHCLDINFLLPLIETFSNKTANMGVGLMMPN